MNTKITATHRALARMLVENTGRHFLDSGGIYGRNWEHNQGKTVEDFMAAPEVTVGEYGVELDLFHYLAVRLEVDNLYTGRFLRWANTGDRANDPWLESMEQWAKREHDPEYGDDKWQSFNSYNDDSLLSQGFDGVTWTKNGAHYVALRIHGGCDARGGYTKPVIFQIMTDEVWGLFEWDRFEVACSVQGSEVQVDEMKAAQPALPGMELPSWELVHAWDHDGHGQWIEWGGAFVGDPWKDSEKYSEWIVENEGGNGYHVVCPRCGAPAEVYARHV